MIYLDCFFATWAVQEFSPGFNVFRVAQLSRAISVKCIEGVVHLLLVFILVWNCLSSDLAEFFDDVLGRFLDILLVVLLHQASSSHGGFEGAEAIFLGGNFNFEFGEEGSHVEFHHSLTLGQTC